MNVIQAIILGMVEGVTEFLPISSTFHQIFASKLLGISQNEFTSLFEVFIQAGAILSVVILYFKDISSDQNLLKKTLTAFVPTAIIGLVLYKVIKQVFFTTPLLMLGVFIGMGVVFIILEYLVKHKKIDPHKHISTLSYKDALVIGIIQAAAVIPGVSRAGAVLVGMMFLRYRRDDSAKFSFILAVPTILAASALDLFKGRSLLMENTHKIPLLLVGSVTAFISSYFVIKWFIDYLKKNSLAVFGIYRLIVGVILFFLHI